MLLAQFSPGPDMLLLFKQAVNHPLRAGLLTICGITCGLAIHSLAAALGLGSLLATHPLAFQILQILGATYLSWIAVKLLRSALTPAAPESVDPRHEPPLSDAAAFRLGFLTNLTNAKAFLFLTSFLATALRDTASLSRAALYIGIILSQALVFWSLFLWLLKRPWLARLYLRSQRPLNALLALLLLLAACQLASTALAPSIR